jgi:hypothetical protein
MAIRQSTDARDVLALLDAEESELLRTERGVVDLAELETDDASWLLHWLAVRRTPFIRMAAGICGMLTLLETSLHGNINFIVLPEQGDTLRADFRPQMRAAIATALRISTIENSAFNIKQKLEETRRRVRNLCDDFRPRPVTRTDSRGKMLAERAATTCDPVERRLLELREQFFSRRTFEFNPADAASMARIAAATRDLSELVKRLSAQTTTLMPAKVERDDGKQTLMSCINQLARDTAAKSKIGSARRSREIPPAPRTVEESHYVGAERAIAALKSALLAACETEQAKGDLFDFFSLNLWQQRWRLYELWIMARVLEWFTARGARPSDTSRIANGTWSLKFTRDSQPVLGLQFGGGVFDLYYQYFEAGAERGNMPDIALKLREGAFIIILDPKHGETYRREELNRICRRYGAAFAPAASCVMNYFSGVEPIERLCLDPACTIIYGLRPESEAQALLDRELDSALRVAWRTAGSAKVTVVILLDVSPSTAGMRDRLCELARQALNTTIFGCSAESCVLLFGGDIAEAHVWDLLSSTLDLASTLEGTDIAKAVLEALKRFSGSRFPGEIWLFTDGDAELTYDDVKVRLLENNVHLRVWEMTSRPAPSSLFELARGVNGDYQAVH